MSKKLKEYNRSDLNKQVEVKSKFNAEFRRFAVNRSIGETFDDFHCTVEELHQLKGTAFVICYTDKDGDLLPINNNVNFLKALTSTQTVLRIFVQKKEDYPDAIGYNTLDRRKENGKHKILSQLPLSHHSASKGKTPLKIGMPEDFRQVSAIIDVDKVAETHRRIRLLKHGSERPLGFYIRDGISRKITPMGLENVPGIFISRLVPGGLAESTGLLSVNDEVVEVNGIEVFDKSLDQVTDMMIANSANLIITVKPANQRMAKSPSNSDALTDAQSKSYNNNNNNNNSSTAVRNSQQRSSQMSASAASTSSFPSNPSYNTDDDDIDEIRDLTDGMNGLGLNGHHTSGSSGSDRASSSSSTAARRDSGNKKRPIGSSQHVTKIILDGKSNGIVHDTEQVFTL